MSHLLLRTATRPLVPILLLFSLFLLWRGHHEPGGGFVGGLVAATAFVLIALAEGSAAARRMLGVPPRLLLACGLAISAAAGLPGLLAGGAYLTGAWWGASFGTPLLFDLGVYLTVTGVALAILLALVEDAE